MTDLTRRDVFAAAALLGLLMSRREPVQASEEHELASQALRIGQHLSDEVKALKKPMGER